MSTDAERIESARLIGWRLSFPHAEFLQLLQETGLSDRDEEVTRADLAILADRFPTPKAWRRYMRHRAELARAKRGRPRTEPLVSRDQLLSAIHRAAEEGAATQAKVSELLDMNDRELRRQLGNLGFHDWKEAKEAAIFCPLLPVRKGVQSS